MKVDEKSERTEFEKRRMVERDPKIPYSEIDPDLHLLIQELNRLGLRTTQCCEGHGRGPAYVSIDMKNIVDVAVRDYGKRLVIWWKKGGWNDDA